MRFRPSDLLYVLAAVGTAACAAAPAPPAPPAPAMAISNDGCGGIRAELAASGSATVEQPAVPVAMKPAAVRTPVPAKVLAADRTPELEVTVVVDTLGKPQMKTFTVVKSSHSWYTTNARTAIAKWTFTPAMHRGCKIERPYKFGFKAGG